MCVFFNDTATTEIYTLSLHDALPICPLEEWAAGPTSRRVETVEVVGAAQPETELSLPFRGQRLRGDDLRRRLDTWLEAGVLEPSAAAAVGQVVDHPEWLGLEGRTVAVLGAAAEMGPRSEGRRVGKEGRSGWSPNH